MDSPAPAPASPARALLIAAVGMAGSGKSVFADAMTGEGIPVVYFGGQVLDEVRARGLPVTPETERAVREDLRHTHGMAAMAHLALPRLQSLAQIHPVVGIDGLYSFSEYKVLLDAFGADLVLVGIVAPKSLRYDRLAQRKIRPLTREQAVARDLSELDKLEKGGPIALADHYIHNAGDLASFTSKVQALLTRLLAGRVLAASRRDDEG